jgi:hypothetical protein
MQYKDNSNTQRKVYQWVERFHMAEKVSLMKKAQAI